MVDKLRATATWGGLLIGFLVAGSMAAAFVPLVGYKLNAFWQASLILVLALLGAPFGGLVAVTVRTRFDALQAELAEAEVDLSVDGQKPLKQHLVEDHGQDPERVKY